MSKKVHPNVGDVVILSRQELASIFWYADSIQSMLPMYLGPDEDSADFIVTESFWKPDTVSRDSPHAWRVTVRKLDPDGTYNENNPELMFYTVISTHYTGPNLLSEGLKVVRKMKQTFI